MKYLNEVFTDFTNAPTRQAKINVLRNNNSTALMYVLIGAFHPGAKFVVEKIPPFKPTDAPEGMAYASIANEIHRMYLFEKNSPRRPALTKERENQILIQILESLDAKEAKILGGMLMKNLEVPGLDYGIVKEAFNNSLP